MNAAIKVITDQKRGCGWRKTGGLYLIGDGPSIACGRLPISLTVCPCCGHGMKPSRGWTWVNADQLIEASPKECESGNCSYCPIGGMVEHGLGKAGLLWIGEEFYKTPMDFNVEAMKLGISRRISAIPNDFKVGETWVLLAHRKATIKPIEFGKEPEYQAGIFRIFKPSRVEVICDGTESDELIESYLRRGLSPVMIQREQESKAVSFPLPLEVRSEQ